MSETDRTLLSIAQALADTYIAHTRPRAVMLVGSTALGLTDNYSDIDLIAYYSVAPAEEHVDAARLAIGAEDYTRSGSHAENYRVRGVECQVGHFLIEEFEQRLATVLDRADPASTVHKELMGLVDGRALHGGDLINQWQLRASQFPERLRASMVEHYLSKIFPLWYCREAMETRDARLWIQQELVQIAISILGVLAAVNRLYFSPMQFKRTHRFVAQLSVAPRGLADRLDGLFGADIDDAIDGAELLLAETLEVVRSELPDANVGVLRHPPGERQQRWASPVAIR